MKQELIEWAKAFIFAVIFVFVFNIFFSITTVFSTSMYPTLIEKDILLMTKMGDINRGDIVSFKSDLPLGEAALKQLNFVQRIRLNKDSKKNLIKRVVAVPGDKIDISEGQVYVNDSLIEEEYISSETIGEIHIEKIADNMYFLMGDNRAVSLDSRNSKVGLVNGDKIFGRAFFRLFPFKRIGIVN